ncbi:MAG: hypothetical protein SOU82_05945 [Alloprevotella sp.]|nr:hypothetical protein [Alloprevotella sp.]MDY4569130.1 hypothetical protein [Alloprevotella sp.]
MNNVDHNKRRKLHITLYAITTAMVLALTFFVARCEGIKEGQREARRQIEAQGNYTDGPQSLITETKTE